MLGFDPNITGFARLRGNIETFFTWNYTSGGGAFAFTETTGRVRNYLRTDGLSLGVDQIQFDASKSEAIYSGASVQPAACQILIIIKV